ncbi:hypothetical protein [Thiohalomonas denitrificans]|uniref:Uncharacterized membrane protein n=1 Tax=Thiohalomonas denitrificans TaxID=415747 RepID=A0A1G5R2X1_9GAMM|nr:hypothetical protein [Thiohalomonas denitrificans]SCZ68412.1 Uncharacterized membrane protein [Thiohalomonas denitrificans]
MSSNRLLLAAIGIGAVAGMRTMTAPAAVAWRDRGSAAARSPCVTSVLAGLAMLELLADKIPTAPDRVETGALAARAASGAWSAAQFAKRGGGPLPGYAAVGAGAAVASAWGFYRLRRAAGRLGIPDLWLGLAEDLLALVMASRVSRAAWNKAGVKVEGIEGINGVRVK